MSDRDDFGAFLIGFVVGGLTGAVVALLFAPQSGEETRTLIKDKSIELRDKAVTYADEAKTKAEAMAVDARTRATEFADDVRTRSQEAIEGVKKAASRKKPAATKKTSSA